jgi:CBS domain containing-hemolysin-like protein
MVSQRMPGSVTDDELKNWVEESQPSGGLEEGERKMIASSSSLETPCAVRLWFRAPMCWLWK